MGLAEEWLELDQFSPCVGIDSRAVGTRKRWVTDWIWRREVASDAEAQAIKDTMGLPDGDRVLPWVHLSRVPIVPDPPPPT